MTFKDQTKARLVTLTMAVEGLDENQCEALLASKCLETVAATVMGLQGLKRVSGLTLGDVAKAVVKRAKKKT